MSATSKNANDKYGLHGGWVVVALIIGLIIGLVVGKADRLVIEAVLLLVAVATLGYIGIVNIPEDQKADFWRKREVNTQK